MKNNFYNGSFFQPPSLYSDEHIRQSVLIETKRKKEKREIIKTGLILGGAIVAFLVIQILSVSVLGALGLDDLYSKSSLFQSCFGVIAIHICSILLPFSIAALLLRKNYISPIVPTKKIKPLTMFMWICLGMGCCMGANYITQYVIEIFKAFGYELTQTETLDPDNALSSLILIITTAIVPGVIEELAMRCFSLGALIKHGKGFAVFAVSIVFGLLHGNVIQFVFAFFVGLAVGYITVKTESVVPAMIIHTCNNGLSVVQDNMLYFFNDDVKQNVSIVLIIGWMILSVVGFFYLLFKREFSKNKLREQSNVSSLSFGTKLACLIPGFFIPFVALIALSITTIHKI